MKEPSSDKFEEYLKSQQDDEIIKRLVRYAERKNAMKATVSVLDNGEYTTLQTADINAKSNEILKENITVYEKFIRIVKDEEWHDFKIEYAPDWYYTFKGVAKIIESNDESVKFIIEIKSVPIEHTPLKQHKGFSKFFSKIKRRT